MTNSLDDGLGENELGCGIVVKLLQYGVVQHSWYWSNAVVLVHRTEPYVTQQPNTQVTLLVICLSQ